MITDDISFAALLTAAGLTVAAGIVTSVVELLKAVFGLPLAGRGAQVAFALSALLCVLAGVATGVGTLDEALVVFVAWLGCSTASVGVHTVIQRARG